MLLDQTYGKKTYCILILPWQGLATFVTRPCHT